MAIPTETVYGLAAQALDPQACRAIFAVKGRPLVDPLIVHVGSVDMACELAHANDAFLRLAAVFWPGPLTMILRKRAVVPDIVTAGKPTVALRMPRHPVAHALLERLGAPLAAPSANPFGYVSPSRPEHVAESFGDRVPFILDGGPCEIGLESTIVDLSRAGRAEILRTGAVSAAEIADVLKLPVPVRAKAVAAGETATAPGTFARHYSPRTPLDLFAAGTVPAAASGEAVIFLRRPDRPGTGVYWLSEDGNPASVARSLFALLRQLDKAGHPRLHCELPPDRAGGLWLAIADRLHRAANRP